MKTIGLTDEVYERLRVRKRGDESVSDLVDRLIDESNPDWKATFGTLPDEEASEFETIALRSAASHGQATRQQHAIAELSDPLDSEAKREDESTNET
ncbi:antitoxin VapB family protein [Natrarchaeobius chitinivorans]|uniref:Antitoxin n=1 Tax=Natrarchaeobius chitinivorans TaxID=1679083 RepID=A0A3N6MYM5_NATCH|nr:antitoxin VapB family protein [Natrarchaeobius chitinivorans]RQG90662.1 hypothetical protein EA473_20345 [Natrarchaeobius chitinivorans]